MRKSLDRVTEAYFGGMGEEFGRATRDRVHWVCEQASGECVLDVGCSQGIMGVILGREGKRVVAIDLSEESIVFARGVLEGESEVTRGLVDFRVGNFMTHDFEGERFDVIILAEVLEHVTEPTRFLRKTASLLRDDGKVVITLPFGINDFFDHKKTYYVTGVLDMLLDGLRIGSFKFLDSYLCFTLERGIEGVSLYSLFSEAEKSFYVKERQFVEARRQDRQQRDLEVRQRLERELVEVSDALELEQRHSSNLNLAISELEQEVVQLKEQMEVLVLSREEKVKTEKLLLASYKKEQGLLKDYSVLQQKYNSLGGSKLGKITLAYWRWRKR